MGGSGHRPDPLTQGARDWGTRLAGPDRTVRSPDEGCSQKLEGIENRRA